MSHSDLQFWRRRPAGCALVLSDILTFRELWDDAAIFIDPHDTKVLHRTLDNLSVDHARRAELQKAARVRSYCYALSGDGFRLSSPLPAACVAFASHSS